MTIGDLIDILKDYDSDLDIVLEQKDSMLCDEIDVIFEFGYVALVPKREVDED
jgi:hypothetical protein